MLQRTITMLLSILFMGLTTSAQSSGYVISVTTTSMLIANDGQCTLIEAIYTVKQRLSIGNADGECEYNEGQATILLEGNTTYILHEADITTDNLANGFPIIDFDISIESATDNPASIVRDSEAEEFRFFEVAATGRLNIEGVNLENGANDRGGAILNEGRLSLSNVRFFSNSASAAGGAIYNAGEFDANEVEFDSNTTLPEEFYRYLYRLVEFAGGAIFNDHDSVAVVANGLFLDNQSRGNGGGIINFGTLTVYDSEFVRNSSQAAGGAIFNNNYLAIHNSNLRENEALTHGGGIQNSGTAFINSSIIDANISLAVGGGLSTHHTLTITETSITNNSASGHGGGIISGDGGTLILIETSITGNQSHWGGGIANYGVLFLNDCCNNIADNIATTGADIYEE